jgi:hypothetical protein
MVGEESAGSSIRPRWRYLSGVRQDRAVEFMDFPAGVIDQSPRGDDVFT